MFPETKFVIGTGLAGALSGGLEPGDIVIADRVLRARKDSAHPEHILAVGARELAHCEGVLSEAGLAFSTGAILTSGRVLPDIRTKRLAKEQSGAIAVDMESAAVALEAASRGIPFAVVRAIMDAVDDEVLGANISDEEGRVRPLAAAGYFATNPGAIVRLPRMMRNLARATRALADAIEALGASPPPA